MNPMTTTDGQLDQVLGSAYQVIKYVAANMETLITLAESVDPLVNSMQTAFEALKRTYAEAGFDLLKASFKTGAAIGNRNHVLIDDNTGIAYSWGGALPHFVPEDSTIESSGGVGQFAWIPQGSSSLRQDLALSNGVSLVGGAASSASLNLLAAEVSNLRSTTGVNTHELRRRSYAEAGYNLVSGSFETGGTLVNANDVLLHEASGKAYSGPAGAVAPETNPTSGGFTDRSLIAPGSGVIRNGKFALRDKISIKDYFVAGEADYTNAMALASADAISSSSGFDTICLEFPSGVYPYTTSPNWAIPRLEIRCNPGVVFKHTGSGKAVVFDGGATGGGVFCVKLTGDPLIQGNASTTVGVYTRAVHHSKFEARVRDVSVAPLETAWAVCNEYNIRSSPLGEPAFAVTPASGMILGERAPLESTSACTFYNPVIASVTTYGLNLQSAVMNTFIGGTVEGCGGGLFISDKCFGNTFNNTDFEFNISTDLFCQGVDNTFIGVLSDKEIEFSAASTRNKLIGGRTNNIKVAGDKNEFHGTLYGIAGGDFHDSGTGTVTRSLVAATGSTPLPDRGGNVVQVGSMGPSSAEALLYGASPLISGGPAADVDLFKRGSGNVNLRAAGGINALSWGSGGLGFYGATPRDKPIVSGSAGGNAALSSLIAALNSLGLINGSGVTP